jgi:hypothetical protein
MYMSTQYDGGKHIPHVRYFSVIFWFEIVGATTMPADLIA